MSEEKAMVIEAVSYEKAIQNSKVYNRSQLEYHLWINLNPEQVREAYFVEAAEIGPDADNSKIFGDTFIRESTCWIRANTPYLNHKIGKHVYKLSFVDRFTDTDFSLYFSYIIQDDCPEKPYVYIKDKIETPEEKFTLYCDQS